ncbi:MAG TPA: ATP synthase subunit I [Blastocatellia bacterium]|nr:ATP synthase subunit I [Blastocatellia bacterium]
MGEDGDQESEDRADSFTDPAAVERRVLRNIFAVIACAIVAAAFAADLSFMLGLLLGGALALFNYKWLHASLKVALATGTGKAAPGTVMKFVLRWVIIGAAVYVASLTGYFNPVAILAGLLSPAVAVMIEAGYVTYKTIVRNGEE